MQGDSYPISCNTNFCKGRHDVTEGFLGQPGHDTAITYSNLHMIPHKEQKTPGAEPREGREVAYTCQATASSLDLNQYSYLYTVKNTHKDFLFQPAIPLWSKGKAEKFSSCIIPTWKGTMFPPFQVSVHQQIFMGEVLQSSWLMMSPVAILLWDTFHPGMPGAASGLSVCPSLLLSAQVGVSHSHLGDAPTHLSTLPLQHTVVTCAYSWSHAAIFPAIITRNWHTRCCFSLTAFQWPLVGLTQVRQASGVHLDTARRNREWNQARLDLDSTRFFLKELQSFVFPHFLPFNQPCHFSKEFGHSCTQMPWGASSAVVWPHKQNSNKPKPASWQFLCWTKPLLETSCNLRFHLSTPARLPIANICK